MDKNLEHDADHSNFLLAAIQKQAVDFLNSIHDRPNSTNSIVDVTSKLGESGLGAEKTLQLFNQEFEPIIVASSGPRYWGYVIGGSTPAAIMGDWLASVYDQNPQ